VTVFHKGVPGALASAALVVVSVCLAVLVCAALLQAFYTPPRIISGWTAIGEVPASERNQFGFRGRNIEYGADDAVVVLLGDSFVEAMKCCSYELMPERRLEQHLTPQFGKKVKVFSLGAGGYGQDQQLLVLLIYLSMYRADLVLLWETPANDIWNNVFPTHWPTNGSPKPTFWLENGILQGPTEQMGQAIATTPFTAVTLLQRVFSPVRRDDEWERRLPPAYLPVTTYEGPVNPAWQQRYDAGDYREENLKTEKSHLAIMLMPPSPRMRYGLELTRTLVREIARIVSERGGRFIAFRALTPEEVLPGPPEVYVLNGLYYKASPAQKNLNMAYVNQDIAHVDIPVTIPNYSVSPSDAHLNQDATDQVMRDLAAALRPLLPERIALPIHGDRRKG